MRRVRGWLARLAGSFNTDRSEKELAEELAAHLQMETDELVRLGMTPSEARRQAVLHSGGVEAAKEAYRDQRGIPFIDHRRRDLAYAFRMMRRSPGFTAIAVTSLGLAIAANAAVFSLTDAVFLRTLPVKDPGALVLFEWFGPDRAGPFGSQFPYSYNGSIYPSDTAGEIVGTSFSMPLFEEVRAEASTLAGIFAFASIEQLNVVTGTEAGVARGQLVTGEYYRTLDVPIASGRAIEPSDDRAGAEAVSVLSFRFWQSRFGEDPGVIGRVLRINGVPTTIVGVTGPGFVGTLDVGEGADITLPMSLVGSISPGRSQDDLADSGLWWVQIMGRRRAGVTLAQAKADIELIVGRALRNPDTPSRMSIDALPRESELQARLVSGARGLNDERRDYRLATALLTIVAGVVLLLACTNVASLLLTRALARRREITMRLALGASRGRILAQLLTEVLVVALLAESFGLLLAVWGKNLLLIVRPSASDIDLTLDARAFALVTLVAAASAILSGLAPALHATRLNLADSLKAAARTTRGAEARLRGTLLVAQISTSVVLLFGSTLFLGTLRNLHAVDVGFNPEQLLIFRVDPRLSDYEGERVPLLYRQLQQTYAALPGVDAVSFARHSLLTGSQRTSGVRLAGQSAAEEEGALSNLVGPDFFATMGIALRSGRDIQTRDDERSRKVAVVNEAFVRSRFPAGSALGSVLRVSGNDWEIVGIAADARYHSLRDSAEPTVYLPFLQAEQGQGSFAIRANVDPATLARSVREATRTIDPTLSIFGLSTQREAASATLGEERVLATTTTAFGVLALILAAIGVYGVMSYATSQRTGEIGLRIALGSTGRGILWLVARRTIMLVVAGVAIGSIVSMLTSRHFSGLLYGLTPVDPASLLLTIGVIAAIAMIAAYIPANRARRISPLEALRHE
jgi:predicted permease